MTDFQPGDRVRVRLDVEAVIDPDGDAAFGEVGELDAWLPKRAFPWDGVTVEKILGPPGPGDVVERTSDPRGIYILGETGYVFAQGAARRSYFYSDWSVAYTLAEFADETLFRRVTAP